MAANPSEPFGQDTGCSQPLPAQADAEDLGVEIQPPRDLGRAINRESTVGYYLKLIRHVSQICPDGREGLALGAACGPP